MKTLTAILGTAFVMLVSVAAVDSSQSTTAGPSVKAAQHASHASGKGCCEKAEGAGMCAREGKDAKGDQAWQQRTSDCPPLEFQIRCLGKS